MPLKYNGKKIIPAPAVGITKDIIKTSDGKKIGATFNITLEGHLIPNMGSPNSMGVFQEDSGSPVGEAVVENKIQYALFKKTEAIRDLFSTDGKLLEIASWRLIESSNDNDAPAMSGYARVTDISFPSDLYQTVLPYTVNLEVDELMCQKLREDAVDPTICELVACDTECTRMQACVGDDDGFVGECEGSNNFPAAFDKDAYSYYTFDVLPNDRDISDVGPTETDLRVFSQSGAESAQPGGNTETLIHSWWDTLPIPRAQSYFVRYPQPVYGSNYVRSRMAGIGGGAYGSGAWGNNFRSSSAEHQSVNGHKGLLVGFWFNSNTGAYETGGGCTNRKDEWDDESMAVEGVVTKSSISSEWSAGKSGATQNTDHPIESMAGEWGIYSHQMPQTAPGSWDCGTWNLGLGFYVNVTDSDKTSTLNSQTCSSSALGYTDGIMSWPDRYTESDGCYDSKSTGFTGFWPSEPSAWGLVFFLIDAEAKESYVIVQFEGETTKQLFKVQDWTGSIIPDPTRDFNVFYNAGYSNSLNDNGDLRGGFCMNYNQDCGLNTLFTIPIDSFGSGVSRYNDVLDFHSGIFNKRQTFQPYYSLNNHGRDATAYDADLTVTNGTFKTSTTTGSSTVTPVSNVGDYFMSFDNSSNSFCTAPVMEIPDTYNDSNGWPAGDGESCAQATSLVGNANTGMYLRVLFWINVANVVGVTGHGSPEMGIITRGGADISGGTGSGQWGLYGTYDSSSSKFEIHAQVQTYDGTHKHLTDYSTVDHVDLDPGHWYLCEFILDGWGSSYNGNWQWHLNAQKVGGAKQAIVSNFTGHICLKSDDTTPLRIGYNANAPTSSHGYLGSEGGEILLQGVGLSHTFAGRPGGFNSHGGISFDDYYNSGAGRVYSEGSMDESHDDVNMFCDLFPEENRTSGGEIIDCPCGITYVDCLEESDWDGLNSCIGSEDFGSALQNIVAESGQSFMDLFSIPAGSTWESEYESQNPDRVFLSSADESWSVDDAGSPKGADTYTVSGGGTSLTVDTDISPTFSLSHTVSAAGKRAYDKDGLIREPWQNSKLWVDSRLGIPSGDASYQIQMPIDVSPVSRMFKMQKARSDYLTGNNVRANVNRFSLTDDNSDGKIDYSPYNYSRQHQIDKTTGNYSITESWTLAKTDDKANVIEEITTEVSDTQESDKTRTVAINGQINGLETRGMDLEIVQSKYEAALERYTDLTETIGAGELLYLIAKQYDTDAKSPYISKTATFNEEEGSITFAYNFDNRTQTITGSISETISIDIKESQDKYAIIPVVGRSSGPVIQDLGTVTLYEATVSAEVIMGDNTLYRDKGPPTISETDSLGLWKKVWPPTNYVLYNVRNISKNESWDPISGVYSKSKTYQWHVSNC